ncbi:vacuolar sorting protein 39 domain 1 [Apiospora arundinis]
MLSAFTARPIIELKPRDKSKIETILANACPIFLTPPSSKAGPPSSKPTDLLREVEKFSTRAVEQLAIIKEANTLISLSNYHVSLYDLQTYELIETIQRTKNASCFAVTSNIVKDGVTGIPEIISRLAVAVKRRLLLWSWHESELGDEVTEIVLPEAIRSITWATATKIVCGMNAGFVLVDVETSTTTEIAAAATAATGQASRGMLLAKDINTLFIDAEGKPVDKRQIPWQSAPDNIGYSYPYILALQPPSKGALEVRNPDTLSLLQNLNLPGAAQLHFPPPTYSLAHAGKGFHISSDRCVWKMDATDYDSQISDLIQQGLLDEAISVLGMLEDALLKDKTGTMREVKMRKAEVLFKAKRYRESMDLFNEDEVRAPPERVLKLFPRMIAGDLSWEAHAEDDAAGTASETDNNEDEEPSAEKKTNGDDAKEEPIEAASPSQAGTGAFSKYWPLGGGHKKTDSDAASIMSTKRGRANTLRDDDASSIKGSDTASVSNAKDDGPLSGDDLKSAVGELRSYLAGTRARLQRYIDPVTGKLKRQASSSTEPSQNSMEDPFTTLLAGSADPESDQQLAETLRTTFSIVDTALFRAYMYSTPALAPSLFRIANFCDPKVVNEKLLESHRYNDLVEFFNGKKLHREALTLLRRFGTASEEPNGHGESSAATAVNDAHDGAAQSDDPLAIPINPSEIPRQLRGPQRTVMYLQALPPDLIDLILEFAEWVLRRDPDLGMDVFLADSENAETLPRERVLKYLEDIDEKLEIRYLEHIIGELGDATPDFHNRLAELFIKVLKEGGGGEQGGNEGEKAPMMDRLIKFLRESRQYSLSKAYGLIPRDDPAFYEAQAVILSNMGSHKQALDIYVFKMQDYVKAEEYCNRIHKLQNEPSRPSSPKARRDSRPSSANLAVANQVSSDPQHQDDPDATPSIYHTLLSLYLTPAPPHQTNLEPALDLLSKHGSRLPAASTLSLIPDDLPTKRLESYFSGRIRAANSRLAESRVVEGLRKTLLVDTQATLLLGDGTQQQAGEGEGGGGGGRNRRVVIGEERVCTVCHKRLGNSVVAVLPDNGVVHYGCLGRSVGKGGKGQVAGSWGRSS